MKLSNKTLAVATRAITTLAVIGFIGASGLLWWDNWSNPQNVFESALTNQLRTKGVTKSVLQKGNSQELNQAIAFSSTGEPVAHADTIITQDGAVEAFVKSETIGTPNEEYVRFTTIETNQKNQSGDTLDFSKIVGVWGDKSTESSASPGPEVYEEFVFGTVPTEYLSQQQADELVDFMMTSGVYTPDYESAQAQYVNKRPVITYTVELDVAKYVETLKKVGEIIGSDTYAETDATALEGRPPVVFRMTVDVLTHRISAISTQTGSNERFESFGVRVPIQKPAETVPFSEIIEGINKAQQS